MSTIWLSATDFIGDPSLVITYPFGNKPAAQVTAKTVGSNKWIYLSLSLPPNARIDEVSICYAVGNFNSFINRVMLLDMSEPDQPVSLLDVPVMFKSTTPACEQVIVSGGVVPTAAVTLALGLEFTSTLHRIILGGVGVTIHSTQAAEHACLESMADLRSLALGAVKCAKVLGYRSPGDGGGGNFYWDASSSDPENGGIVIVPAPPGTGRWKRLMEGNLSVKWFGAVGDGNSHPLSNYYATLQDAQVVYPHATSLDDEMDWVATQAAIDAARAAGITRVVLPVGTFIVNRSIDVWDHGAQGGRGTRISGEYTGSSGDNPGTTITWKASTMDPMIRLWNRDCVVEGFRFLVGTGFNTVAAIDIDWSSELGASICTANVIRDCRFLGQVGILGVMQIGVRIGAQNFAATEYMQFINCYFGYMEQACVAIPNTTGQSKSHTFHNCGFTFSPNGIYTASGSFQMYSCAFSWCDVGISLGAPTDNIWIVDCDSEGCQRFLVMGETNSPAIWQITILGGRFALSNLAPDGEYIIYTVLGTLKIADVFFDTGLDYRPNFKIRASNPYPATMLTIEDCVLPNDDPVGTLANEYCRLRLLGNVGVAPDNSTMLIDDECSVRGMGVPPPPITERGRLRLATVGGLSGKGEPTWNLRGQETIADVASVAPVAFTVPESDSNYVVLVSIIGETGTPASGASRARVQNRTQNGFDIVLEQAPGAGNTVNVGWVLVG